MGETRRFPIRVDRKWMPLLALLGVRSGNAYVDVRPGGDVVARFGFFRFRTPLANVRGWRIEGPWLWLTAIGVRASIRHHDVTFGGNTDGGVRLDFRVWARFGLFRIPALYVTVEDLEGLAGWLAGAGIAGEDARTRRLP